MKRYIAVSCNHTTATPASVGRAHLPADALDEALPAIKERIGADELVYLATCHRAEWYMVHSGPDCPGRIETALASALSDVTDGTSALPDTAGCFAASGRDAARHLFRVACGIESLMVGDNQILGQTKDAFRRSESVGLTGALTTALFTQAFRAAKRVRSETSLSRGAVSLVSLAERRIASRLAADPAPVAVVGAGKTATLAAGLVRNLDAGRRLLVFNRGRERGGALATRVAGEFRPLETLRAVGERCAAVIVGASAPEPLVGPELASSLAPTLLLDLGMPPAVDPACGGVAGIEHVAQTDLRAEAEAARSARRDDIGRVEEIIEEQLEELAYEVMEVELSPVAHRLLADFQEVVRSEMTRVAGGDGTDGRADLEAAVERVCRRLIRVPLRGLREVAWQHTPEVLTTFLAAVRR